MTTQTLAAWMIGPGDVLEGFEERGPVLRMMLTTRGGVHVSFERGPSELIENRRDDVEVYALGHCDACGRDGVPITGARDRYDESLAFCVDCVAGEPR